MKKVAVILSGCGVYDGAEIHESVLTILALENAGAEYQCFAPDVPQRHVVNHLTGEVDESDSRNVLVESARITRGAISDLATINPDEFDALIIPGGFGVAKNLCSFAVEGADSQVNEVVLKACKAFAEKNKTAGYACIAPAIIPAVYPEGVKLTVGNDRDTINALESMGAQHIEAKVGDVVEDDRYHLFTTPAYMLASNMKEAATSIQNLVAHVLK